MALYMVSYDLHQPGRHYESLWAELGRLGARRLLASDWAVDLNNTAGQVRDHFRSFIDDNDSLLVTKSDRHDWAGWNAKLE
jgi:hypothetical protein